MSQSGRPLAAVVAAQMQKLWKAKWKGLHQIFPAWLSCASGRTCKSGGRNKVVYIGVGVVSHVC